MNELNELAKKFGTDKQCNESGQSIYHDYTPTYYELFKDKKNEFVNFLEIGVWFGASHLMWSEFFPNTVIYGLDNFSGQFHKYKTENPSLSDQEVTDILNQLKISLETEGIIIYVGDQSNKDFLKTIGYEGKYDVIIDDGSHGSWDVQNSFDILWDFVKPGGYYIIEDLAVCLMREFRQYDDERSSSLEFIKSLADENPFSYYVDGEKLKRIHNEIEIISFAGELGIIKKK